MTSTDVKAVAEVAESEGLAGVDQDLIGKLVEQAREQGLNLAGEGGLLQQLTKRVLESALEGEITDHLGYDKHDPAGHGSGNSRNGTRAKAVTTLRAWFLVGSWWVRCEGRAVRPGFREAAQFLHVNRRRRMTRFARCAGARADTREGVLVAGGLCEGVAGVVAR